MGKEMVSIDREDPCLHQLFERQVRRSPRTPTLVDARGALASEELDRQLNASQFASETHELWDSDTYDDSNTRRALGGSGLWRPGIGASLFGTSATTCVTS